MYEGGSPAGRKLAYITSEACSFGGSFTMNNLVRGTEVPMLGRWIARKYDFQHDGVVYAWKGYSLVKGGDITLYRYPEKQAIAEYDRSGLSLSQMGIVRIIGDVDEKLLELIVASIYTIIIYEKSKR